MSSMQAVLKQVEQSYIARTPKSRAGLARAAEVLPGGDTRSVLNFSPYGLLFESGKGATLTDADGNIYRDFVNDFGAGLYGHTQPAIQEAIIEVVRKGLTIGGINKYESELARELVNRFPALEKVRFTNSGSEANLMAITTARLATGREKILVMDGGYHGGVLMFHHVPDRINAPYDFVYGQFNDLRQVESAVAGCRKELAAIVVEPMLGAGGCVPAEPSFLQGLRRLADETGAILIFDEVLTSRIGPAGAQGLYGVIPDMMTCGKYLGGGGNFGAFGGKSELMEIYNTLKPNSAMHGGTFNNNVITMAAGVTGLRHVFPPQVAERLRLDGDRFRDELAGIAGDEGVTLQVTGMGPVMMLHHHDIPVRSHAEAELTLPEARTLVHLALLERGIYTMRRGGVMLSTEHTQDDFEAFKQAFRDVLRAYREPLNSAAAAARRKAA